VSTRVTNTGNVAGFETVQLYIRDNFSEVTRPVKELKGFKKIKLAPGQSKTVEFDVKPNMLAYYNLEMDYVIEPGRFTLMLGSSSRKSDLKKVQLKVE
jgi:beta-glucosidase